MAEPKQRRRTRSGLFVEEEVQENISYIKAVRGLHEPSESGKRPSCVFGQNDRRHLLKGKESGIPPL